MSGKWIRSFFWDDENVLKLIEVIVIQVCHDSENH